MMAKIPSTNDGPKKLTKKLRKIFLSDPTVYRDTIITDHQIEIVELVARFEFLDTTDYAAHFNVSRDTGSSQLKRLCDKGYLKRRGVRMEGGRREFIYEIK